MPFVLRALALGLFAALASAMLLFQPQCETAAAQARTTLPPDLALVPPDAAGFLHVRGADLWKNEIFAGFRATFEKAGPKALGLLDKQFVPKPSTFDRFTGFVLLEEGSPEPIPLAILRFSEPFEIAEVVTTYLPKASSEKVNGKMVYRGEAPFEMYFPDHQHLVIGLGGSMAKYLKHEFPKTGPLSSGLTLAAAGKPVVFTINIAALPIPPKELADLPSEVKPLLKAEHVTASLGLGEKLRLELVAGYKTSADAEAAEKSIKALAEMGRKELAKQKDELEKNLFDPKHTSPRPGQELPETLLMVFGLGALNQLDELLANPGQLIKLAGNDLTAGFDLPKESVLAVGSLAAISTGLLIPAVQKLRVASGRMQSLNNMKQIGLACLNYENAYGCMPQDIVDKNGKPLLSWRVAILPFLEQQALFNKFKLDEPWNSEHNKPWSDMAIKTYMSPDAVAITPPGMTHYKGFAGPGTVFEPGKKIRLVDIADGTSNTILIVEAGEPIPWAKPGDIPYDPKKPLPKLALPGVPDIVNFGMCDDSVRTANMKTLTEKTLRNLITRNDGNLIGPDW
jgi:hypothetical protein